MTVLGDFHRAFLRAIISNPDDDLPRLIAADWLEENAGTVECHRIDITSGGLTGECENGRIYKMRECKDGIYRNAWADCPACSGTGRVSNGNAERAEFIRVQCAFEWHPFAKNIRERDYDARDGINAEWHRGFDLFERANRLLEIAWSPKGLQNAAFRRGFVHEVRVPTLATLFGGPCGTCGHRGRHDIGSDPATEDWCNTCDASGCTPGIAAQLFAEHPVQVVRVGDREPFDYGHTTRAWYNNDREDGSMHHPESEIPGLLFAKLTRPETPDNSNESLSKRRLIYEGYADADDALSVAICAHGRALAFPVEEPVLA